MGRSGWRAAEIVGGQKSDLAGDMVCAVQEHQLLRLAQVHRQKKATIFFGADQSVGLVAEQFAPIDFVWTPLGIDLSIQDSVAGCVPDGLAHSVGDRHGNLGTVLQIDDV